MSDANKREAIKAGAKLSLTSFSILSSPSSSLPGDAIFEVFSSVELTEIQEVYLRNF